MSIEKIVFYSTGTLLLLIGLGATAGGIAFILEPNGDFLVFQPICWKILLSRIF